MREFESHPPHKVINVIEKEYLKKAIEDAKASATDKNKKRSAYIVRLMSKPKRQRVSVNLAKLEKLANSGENVIVPGKVLGRGTVTKKINVAAVVYSSDAEKKLKEAGCTVIGIKEMLKKDDVRIII